MAKTFLRLAIVITTFLCNTSFARTPIETFIYHVKESHELTPVSNLWQPDNSFINPALREQLSKSQMLRMDPTQLALLMKQQNFALSLTVPGINGGSYTIELGRYDFRADGFTIHVEDGTPQGKDIHELPGLFYRGVVKDIPGSLAAFSFFDDKIYGLFSIPGVGNFVVGSNAEVGDEHYILYNSADFLHPEQGPACGTDALQGANTLLSMARTTTKLGEKVLNSCKQVRVYEVADYYTYKKKVSLTNTINYLSSLFNCQSLVYKNEGVIIALKYLQVYTDSTTDPYHTISSSNSGDWLNSFGYRTKNNMHGANLAMLFTTVKRYMGGIAWLGTICNGYDAGNNSGPYAFCNVDGYVNPALPTYPPSLNYFWDVNVTTHEMGHNLGSPHTHACWWNGNNTAIDGCYTIEGSCGIPSPQYPTAGGTIMSYCHLVSSVGVNFSNGFGPQPGTVIRAGGSMSCDTQYTPANVVNIPNKTFTANMQCTDPAGITYYWNDSNTANQADDKLLLMVKKGTNNIGTLDSAGFSVTVSTLPGYSSGSGQPTTFPSGTSYIGANTVALNRYWKMAATKVPVSAIEVMFPFSNKDTADVNGTLHWALGLPSYNVYTINGSTVDPNPANNFAGATVSNIAIYGYSTTPTTSSWSFSTMGSLNVAHFKMTNLTSGGGMYYTYGPTSLSNTNGVNAGIAIYPNPFSNQLSVTISNGKDAQLELYAADGKVVKMQPLYNGTNTVNITNLPIGMYFYRIVSSNDVYTGKLQKQ